MRVPKLCRHKGSGQGYGTFDGRNVYFGRWPAELKRAPVAVENAYLAHVERWLVKKNRQAGEPVPKLVENPCIDQLWLAYWKHAKAYYVKHGRQTSEVSSIVQACRIVARLFGQMGAWKFGPLHLKAVRSEMIRKGWARKNINKQISRVRGMFRWGVENQIVRVDVLQALKAVAPLAKGRTAAKESPPVLPVSWEDVEATLPKLAAPLPDMVRVHYLLGCRAQDVVIMRPCDIDRSGAIWLYTPSEFKGEHLDGATLQYWIGPLAQAILKPLLIGKKPGEWLFSTRGKKGGCRRSGRYSTSTYRRAIARACERAKVARWSPLQVRHARLTAIRAHAGIEASQAVASHKDLSVTALYAERSAALAQRVMAEIG